jgi:outer membrane lipoprotein-sorting protein
MRSVRLALMALLVLGATGTFAQLRPRRVFGGNPLPKAQRPPRRQWAVPAQIPPALKQALGAIGRLHYSGTRVIEAKVGANRQSHTEYVVTDGVSSRIEFPKDSPLAGQVIVENGVERRQFFPGRNELQVGPAQRDEAIQRLIKLVENRAINVSETSGGNYAGMPTELVSIADRMGNVKQKLWIEARSGMILRREIYDKAGALQASLEFTQANLNPVIRRDEFRLDPKGANVVTPERRLDEIIRRQGYQDVRIPAGTPYRLEGARMQKIGEQQVLVQQYAGNGHRITLYQLKVAVDPSRLGKLERTDLQIYFWQSKGSSFVLMGDLSDAELKDLGRRLGG